MLKKILILIASVLIFAPQTVFALDNTATSTPSTVITTRPLLQTVTQRSEQQLPNTKPEILTKLQDFREKIKTIRDTRKKQLVLRIDDRIATSNANLTNKMSEALKRMSFFLTNLATKSSALKASGKDTTALDAAIANAQTAITTAQAAVDTQKAKTYTAEITDDSLLKGAIGQMVSGFRLDIMATYKTVIDAKQAVMKAVSELAQLNGVGDLNASKSANIKD